MVEEENSEIYCTYCNKPFVKDDIIISVVVNEERYKGNEIFVIASVALSNYHKRCAPVTIKDKIKSYNIKSEDEE